MALKNEKEFFQEFEDFKDQDFSRKGLDFEFVEADIQLKKIAEILDGVKNYTPKQLKGRTNLHGYVLNATKEFNDICKSIINFNTSDQDPNRTATQIKQKARQLYDKILVPDSNSKYSTFPALALEWKLKNADLNEVNNLIDQIEDAKDRASSLLKQIENSSRSKFAHDYSEIFHQEAIQHSRITARKGENKKGKRYGIGFAEGYLILGIILIGILLYLVTNDFFIPESSSLESDLNIIREMGFESVTYTQVLIPFYLKKLIILGLLIFGLRFSFKQFSIHKHLHTVNKHRANTLDSFEFFHNNLKDGDSESRDQYLIEVAKSIFNLKETGFIKMESKESISFVDNFKFFRDES